MINHIKDTLASFAFWRRTFTTLIFLIVFYFFHIFLLILSIGQWLFVLFTGSPNQALQSFSGGLGQFSAQLIHYVTYHSEHAPFPMSDWPTHDR